jgi:phosphatidylserine decarboxylase
MMKLAPEGYPFIIFFSVITFIAFIAGGIWVALLPFILTLFMMYFFRDPERITPEGDNIFVSPADGKVILIKNVDEDVIPSHSPLLKEVEGGYVEVSIFMSPLNVHVNRAPCDGIVESVVHTKGKFLSAFKPEASFQNENIAMLLSTKHGKILVRQVAGFVARRAVCRVKPGDSLKKGERYGIIKFSSRLDVYLPKDAEIKVKLGDKVKAGETIIGTK